ncbi:hypothetical protein TWF694_000283 [Orbilia ellipsospora]|uniref:Uncharacterized protein n=1 Tax=Orbilia ellipsospora TaxID=2528407 RepID=A0AAV9XPQ0_9PEZI
MLKLILFASFIVTAVTDGMRSGADQYHFAIREPTDCGNSTCPTSKYYSKCGSGQCVSGICGNWSGYEDYCCTIIVEMGPGPLCNDTRYTGFLANFTSFDTSGTPALEVHGPCPTDLDGVFWERVGPGINDPKDTICCPLDGEAIVLYQNTSWPNHSLGDPAKARCVDMLVPDENAQTPSATTTQSGPKPTSTGSSGASNNQPAIAAAGVIPVILTLLAIYF